MPTKIPRHADTSTKTTELYWQRWAAVGDARDVVHQQRGVVAQLKAVWGACRRKGLAKGQTCSCGQCEARVMDALEAMGHAVAKYDAAVAKFKGN